MTRVVGKWEVLQNEQKQAPRGSVEAVVPVVSWGDVGLTTEKQEEQLRKLGSRAQCGAR